MALYPEYQGTYASMLKDSVKVYDLLRHDGVHVTKTDVMEALIGTGGIEAEGHIPIDV